MPEQTFLELMGEPIQAEDYPVPGTQPRRTFEPPAPASDRIGIEALLEPPGPEIPGGDAFQEQSRADFFRDLFAPTIDPKFADAPELASTRGGLGGAARQLPQLFSPDPEAQFDMIRARVPNVLRREDAQGRILVRFPEDSEFAYLNKPGASWQDLTTFLTEGLLYAPGAIWSAGGRTLAWRVGRGAFAGGGTSVGQDVAAGQLGSEQGIDPGKALLSAAGEAGGELLAPLVGRVMRRFSRVRGPARPTPAEGPMGVRVERARQQGITLNEAQARQDTTMLTLLNRARAGKFGEDVRITAQLSDIQQGQQLSQAGRNIGERMGSAIDPASPGGPMGQGGELIGEGLRREFDEQVARVAEAYSQVGDATFTGSSLDDMIGSVVRGVEQTGVVLDPQLTPQTVRAMGRLRELVGRMPQEEGIAGITARLDAEPLDFRRDFETTRRVINQHIEAAELPSDRRALMALRDSYDDWLDDAADNALFQGDEGFIESWRAARGARAEQSRLFASRGRGDQAGQTIEKIVQGDVSGRQVADWMAGNAIIGQTDRAVNLARHLRTNFPEQHQVLREAVAYRIMFGKEAAASRAVLNPDATTIAQARSIYPTITRNMAEAMDGRGLPYMRELFSPEEITAFRNYGRTIRDLTGDLAPVDLTNRAGTAAALGSTIWQGFLNIVPTVSGARFLTQQTARPASEMAARSATRRAIAGASLAEDRLSLPMFAAAGGATGALAGTSAAASESSAPSPYVGDYEADAHPDGMDTLYGAVHRYEQNPTDAGRQEIVDAYQAGGFDPTQFEVFMEEVNGHRDGRAYETWRDGQSIQ